jgi:LysM repeat protein
MNTMMIDEEQPLDEIPPHDEEVIPQLDAPPLDEIPLDETQTANVTTTKTSVEPTLEAIADPYLIKKGDTLSAIAKRCGHSVAELKHFNHVSNPNQLEVGQTLYLSEKSALGVSVLFLDPLRHPIENLPYQLRYDGKVVNKTTNHTGATARQITRNAQSSFEVWIHNSDQQWQQIANTVSGYGHKLITLVSNSIVIKGKTELHPHNAPLTPETTHKPPVRAQDEQPPAPKPAAGTPSKNNKHIKTKHKKAPKGQPVIKVEVDIPSELVTYFANYKNVALTEDDWARVANQTLDCEVNVLKAIAQVESGGKSPFWLLNKVDGAHVPVMLYERHKFSFYTKHEFDNDHSDISWKTPYIFPKEHKVGEDNIKMHNKIVSDTDFYSNYTSSYLRLIKAYNLNKEAALMACSWGKFQIMGESYAGCCKEGLAGFVTAMCTSEAAQIDMLAGFIKSKPVIKKMKKSLLEAVQNKDWHKIAFYYNGRSYKKGKYHTKLEQAYGNLEKAKT